MNSQAPTVLTVYRLPANREQEAFPPASHELLEDCAKYMQQRYDALKSRDAALRNYIEHIRASGLRAAIFGGWARDALLEVIKRAPTPSRDIDLVVDGESSITTLLGTSAVPNVFGGIGVKADTISLDAWDLRETFLIKRYRLPVSFETLPETADYTFNGVLFLPADFFGCPSVIEKGAVGAIQAGVVELSAADIAMPLVQAARAVILAVRMNFRLSATVKRFIRDVCSADSSAATVLRGIETYCPKDLTGSAVSLFSETLSQNPK
jgi:hypothetical protein